MWNSRRQHPNFHFLKFPSTHLSQNVELQVLLASGRLAGSKSSSAGASGEFFSSFPPKSLQWRLTNYSQEFYLSSKNLRRDPRMLSRVLYNDEGYVKLSRIMRMHRMRSLPISSELVAKIIRDNSTRLQMSFSNVSVRRSPSLR